MTKQLMNYRFGVLQLPVFREGFTRASKGVQRSVVFTTGIRCPRCQQREIVYNGNYFCAGYGDSWTEKDQECGWVLPNLDSDDSDCAPGMNVPKAYADLWDAIRKTIPKRDDRP